VFQLINAYLSAAIHL